MTAELQTWEEAVSWLREQPGARDLVDACFFDDPLPAAAERYRLSSEWAAVRSLLPDTRGYALDVGSGRGISAYALARDGWDVAALEPDPSAVVGAGAIRSLAAETGTAIKVVETWGESLPFADASFDLVHCRQVLHHARDLQQLCREIGRVLRPGGVLIATREHVISRPGDLKAFQDAHPLHRLYGGENAFLLAQYKAAIEGAGIGLTHVLNPNQSDINLFPRTRADLKARWAAKLGLPIARFIPDAALSFSGALSDVPGRVYSFVGRKPGFA